MGATQPPALVSKARQALRDAEAGDFRAIETLVDRCERASDTRSRGWGTVLRAAQWTAQSEGSPPLEPAGVGRWIRDAPETREAACFAAVEGLRWAVLAFEPDRASQWVSLLREQVQSGDPPDLTLRRQWAELWQSVLQGEWDRAAEEATRLEADASAAKEASLVIEAAAGRALALAARGDLQDATTVARRASRMARTESLPQPEYFAHLVLARVRRLTGSPHLATRILRALRQVASPVWLPWLQVEMILAGDVEGGDGPGVHGDTPASRAVQCLRRLVVTAEAADRDGFEQASRELEEQVRFAPLAEELRVLLDACDAHRIPEDPSLLAWIAGATADPPSTLHGLLTREGSAPQGESAIAYVVSHPDIGARRMPRLAWGVLGVQGLHVLHQTRRKQGRVETLVSVLLLAGEQGMEETECFSEVYGFEYEEALHKGVFDVLLHRARGWVGEAATIERTDGRLQLHTHGPLLVPDPRCTKPMQDRILRAVAQHKGATAKEVARALGVSVRVAQSALQELASSGACLTHRHGRHIHYAVEDTTFSEPTHHAADAS
jgi:hypothetical protein